MLFAKRDDWLLKVEELVPGDVLVITEGREGLTLAGMQAAIDAAYPERKDLTAQQHGSSVWVHRKRL